MRTTPKVPHGSFPTIPISKEGITLLSEMAVDATDTAVADTPTQVSVAYSRFLVSKRALVRYISHLEQTARRPVEQTETCRF